MLKTRKTCRVCRSPLSEILNLGEMSLPGYDGMEGHKFIQRKIPLVLARCCPEEHEDACGLVQLRHTTPGDLLYPRYFYRSGINRTMTEHLHEIAQRAIDIAKPEMSDLIIDIGCNDGTSLSYYAGKGFRNLFGFDPARNMAEHSRKTGAAIVEDYFNFLSHKSVLGYEQAKIISSIAMFYDLEDPNEFVNDVREALRPDGVWVLEMSYLPTMLEQVAFDTVCLHPDQKIVTEKGLVSIVDIKNGDFVLTHQGSFEPVLETFVSDFSGELIILEAYGTSYDLKVTPNHPIMVNRGNGWEWIPAESVKKGDLVARPVLKNTEDKAFVKTPGRGIHRYDSTIRELPVDENLMAICGWYLAEGFVTHGRSSDIVNFSFGVSEKEQALANKCADYIKGLGLTARVWKSRTSTLTESGGVLARFLESEFGTGAGEKKIPSWILRLPNHKLKTLLEAYIEGDGYLYRSCYYRAVTVSSQLAFDLSIMANKLGYKTSICEQQRPQKCIIEGRTVNQRPLWDVLIHTEPKKKIKTWMESGYQVARIKKVSKTPYDGKVYNLNVSKEHTYVTPTCVVHNCHEHLEYYSLTVIEKLLDRHNLVILDLYLNDTNGGSIQLYVGRSEGWEQPEKTRERIRELKESEFEMGLDTYEPYAVFSQNVYDIKRKLSTLLQDLKAKGKKVFAYGASTKGAITLQWCGINNDLVECCADRNPIKWGTVINGTGIPIVSEDEARARKPDYFLVLPWHFMKEFKEREKEFLDRGGQFIVPVPQVKIVGRD